MTDHQALKTYMAQDQGHQRVLKDGYCDYSLITTVCFVSSRNKIADVLSRLTKNPASQGYIQDEKCVREITLQAVPLALRTEEIEEATAQDEDLKVGHNTPLWPRANGEVERENRALLKAMGVFQAEGKNCQAEVNKFLPAYRSTNHSTTVVSPAELLFRRKLIRVIGASRL